MANKLFGWVEGMHKTGYYIFTLARVSKKRFPIPFDCYILKYPPGSSIPPHKDQIKGKHYRANFVLTHPKGGEFRCEKPIFQSKWLNLFRPDISTHSVTTVEGDRTRYVFSMGWNWRW